MFPNVACIRNDSGSEYFRESDIDEAGMVQVWQESSLFGWMT